MGVDFYPCSNCRDVFCDAGEYAYCDTCGSKLCDRCMKEFHVTFNMANLRGQDRDDEYSQCPFCSKSTVSDDTLLKFALKKLETTKEELVEVYKKEAKN